MLDWIGSSILREGLGDRKYEGRSIDAAIRLLVLVGLTTGFAAAARHLSRRFIGRCSGGSIRRPPAWLPKLHYPIRVGEHDQTAFSFGLIWDWAGIAGDSQMRALLSDAARRFYRHDRKCR